MKIKYFVLLVFTLALIAGCKKETVVDVSPFVGNYVITKASLSEALTLNTQEIGPISVPVTTDITQAIQTALLSAVTCSSADKSYIELRKENTLYLSCEEQNPLNAGTWEEISETSLRLNMNSAAIPTSPSGFVLTVTDVALLNDVLSGETSVPLPQTMLAAMVTQISGGLAHLDLANTPVALPVKFVIELRKK